MKAALGADKGLYANLGSGNTGVYFTRIHLLVCKLLYGQKGLKLYRPKSVCMFVSKACVYF